MGGLYVRALTGGPEKKIRDSTPNRGYAITSKGIYYVGAPATDGSSPLWLLDPVTSKRVGWQRSGESSVPRMWA